MVKKTKTPNLQPDYSKNSQPDDFNIKNNIIDSATKGIINEKKEDKQSLDEELISHINKNINLINSQINELNAEYNNLSYESVNNNLTKQANKITTWVLRAVFIGLISILMTFIVAIYKIPKEFVVKNNLSKEDIKEIIQYTYQQQNDKIIEKTKK